MKTKKYPNWVCQECGSRASGGRQFQISTWHKAKCDVCGKVKHVTEPRDFYNPFFDKKLEVIKIVAKTPCYCCTSGLCGKARPRKTCTECKGTGKYSEAQYYHIYIDKNGQRCCFDGETIK